MEFVASGSGYWSGLDVSCAGCTRHCSGSFAAGDCAGSVGSVGAGVGVDGVGVDGVGPDGLGDGSLGDGDAAGSVGVEVAVGAGVGVDVVGDAVAVGVGVSVASVAEGVV